MIFKMRNIICKKCGLKIKRRGCYQKYCEVCSKREWKKYAKEWRKKNKDKWYKRINEWKEENRDHIREWNRNYNKRNRKRFSINAKKYRQKYPEKIKAHNKAKNIEIIKGKLCEICNINLAKEKHHPNYFKPFDVKFLCVSCHNKTHIGKELC